MSYRPVIASVRLGHANNSSSTHSLLIGAKAKEILSCQRGKYDWEWFHLRSPEWKANYLSTLIYCSLRNDPEDPFGPEIARFVAREATGDDPLSGVGPNDEPYIDHNSLLDGFPRSFGRKYLDLDFLRGLSRFIIRSSDVTIRGGNDNGSSPIDFGGTECDIALSKTYGSLQRSLKGTTCRRDGDWWVVYNPATGAKIRLSFEKDPKPYAPRTPELVDLKITDRCHRECNFCYQGSSSSGDHADLKRVKQILWGLAEARVFEVALGGGEPTLHPGFPDIVREAHRAGITPNFSTGTMEWASCEEIRSAVIRYCGSFAVSNPKCLEALVSWNARRSEVLRSGGGPFPEACFQIPLGCLSRNQILDVLQAARLFRFRVILLGYKRVGRAANRPPEPYEWVLEEMRSFPVFGADSVFVAEFREELEKRGISPKLLVPEEGTISCYIDAVGLKAGASSFSGRLVPVDARDPLAGFPFEEATKGD